MKVRFKFLACLAVIISVLMPSNTLAHCEVPCGVYGDSLRINLLYEHITTVERAMKQITDLSKDDGTPNYNQIVRWVNNKESHASEIQEIVSQYFMHQRIKIAPSTDKEAYERYTKQLTLMHKMQVLAMKAKQGTDLECISQLRKTLHQFEHAYWDK